MERTHFSQAAKFIFAGLTSGSIYASSPLANRMPRKTCAFWKNKFFSLSPGILHSPKKPGYVE